MIKTSTGDVQDFTMESASKDVHVESEQETWNFEWSSPHLRLNCMHLLTLVMLTFPGDGKWIMKKGASIQRRGKQVIEGQASRLKQIREIFT